GRVPEPAREERLLEEQPQMREGGRLVEEKRIVLEVVEVARPLERGDEHPIEGEGESTGERDQDPPSCGRGQDPAGAPTGRHQPTSARCAVRSILHATSTRMGSRKMEIAAPSARSLPRMPVKKAS